jgi:hypothetical protein
VTRIVIRKGIFDEATVDGDMDKNIYFVYEKFNFMMPGVSGPGQQHSQANPRGRFKCEILRARHPPFACGRNNAPSDSETLPSGVNAWKQYY